MSKKAIKAAAISIVGLLAVGGGLWYGGKNLKKTTVNVYSMSELSQQVFGETASLEGSVSSNVSQEVRLMEKQIVSAVHVQEGQEVKEGDPLLTYDMTLVNIDLETARLNKQQLEVKKKGLEQELKKLKEDVSLLAAGGKAYKAEFSGEGEKNWKLMETAGQDSSLENGATQPSGGENPDGATQPSGGENPDGATQPSDGGNQGGETQSPGGGNSDGAIQPPSGGNPDGDTQPPGEENPDGDKQPPEEETPQQEFKAYSRLYWNMNLEDPIPPEEETVLEQAVPYRTEEAENTYYFLCKKDVWIQGAFLNYIAGFRDGEERVTPALCVLEQRSEDKTDGILLAQITIRGDKIEEKFEDASWYRSKLGLDEWEKVEIPEQDVDFLPGDFVEEMPVDDIISGYSKEELEKAIGEKEREISTAALDIKDAELKIEKVEKELQDETVRSTINGVVKKAGDPAKGEIDGEAFIVVESTGGTYIQGVVGEDALNKIEPGQMLTGMGYESMTGFQAEIKEVSQYPASNYAMYSDRELSYYPFTAYIEDSTGLKDNEMVRMDLPQEEGNPTGIFVSKEFVRSKDGEDFVYKEGKNGRLEKQVIKTGQTFYGYLIEIKEGVTQEDYLAFPYGKKVKDGARVKRSELSQLYNMY